MSHVPGPRDPAPVRIRDLGRRSFAPVHRDMIDLLGRVHRGESEGECWLVEHEPVYTAGRATPKESLDDRVVPVERGGQITYHGPGQLVVYPIVSLPSKDVRAWLRALEAFGVCICQRFGLAAVPSADGTGVFVDGPDAAGHKLASIGVAIRHWINLHGIAINVAMDLSAFHTIRPCGLDPAVMTDLSHALDRPVSLDEARAAARACLPVLLGCGYASSQ